MHHVLVFARRSRSIVLALMASVSFPLNAQSGGSSSREVHLMVPVDSTGLRVFLRHLPPAKGTAVRGRAPVLFVHGASFPSALAAAFRFDGISWMDDLANQGFDVWALDFLGYGGSDRYPEMAAPAEQHPPLGRAPEAARQIAAAVERIVAFTGVSRVSLIAHSWGTTPAGLYSGEHPERVERLVLFGPVTQRAPSEPPAAAARAPAHWLITEEDQRSRFFGYLPKGERPVLDTRHFAVWGPAYMATDPESGTRRPASVRIPAGPIADFNDAWSGRLPFDPAKVRAPTLIIRGEWENITTDADARWLFDALTGSPIKRDVKISRGSHVMHLEESRTQLYREVAAFLRADDSPPKPAPERRTAPGAPPRGVRVVGFGALSGPLQSFGRNSQAALRAAADSINRSGGVRLAQGAASIDLSYDDDACDPARGVELVRGYAATDVLAAVGPSCSSVAERLFTGMADDPTFTLPVITDGAMKAGLARLSRWAFRNVPDEAVMYRALWAWVRKRHPELHSVFGGEEADFAHSHASWVDAMAPLATAAGLIVVDTGSWSLNDTTFDAVAERIRGSHADIVVLSSHSQTTCGVLRAMYRLGLRPALVVGLTSAANDETLHGCAAAAEGMIIPTSYAPVTPAARTAADATKRFGGSADLHSMAAWEVMFALRTAIERAGIAGRSETLAADREALRRELTRLHAFDGVLGPVFRTRERESVKPFVLVQARGGQWQVLWSHGT